MSETLVAAEHPSALERKEQTERRDDEDHGDDGQDTSARDASPASLSTPLDGPADRGGRRRYVAMHCVAKRSSLRRWCGPRKTPRTLSVEPISSFL